MDSLIDRVEALYEKLNRADCGDLKLSEMLEISRELDACICLLNGEEPMESE